MKTEKVTHYELSRIVESRKPIGLFYAQIDNVFVAVDNRNGEAWTEEFTSEDEAVSWLNNDEAVVTKTLIGLRGLNHYQVLANETAIYPENQRIIYPALGLNGEAGEVADKVKKVLRDNDGNFTDEKKAEIAKELGDVLWYVSTCARDIGYTLEQIANMNIEKLRSRQLRGQLNGSGDNR